MEEVASSGVSQLPKRRSAQGTSHIPTPVRNSPHSTSPLVSSVAAKDISKKSAVGVHTGSHIPLPNRRSQSPLPDQGAPQLVMKSSPRHQTGGSYYSRFQGSVTLPEGSLPHKMSATPPPSSLTSITPSTSSSISPSSTPQRHAMDGTKATTDSSTSATSSSIGNYSSAKTTLTSSSSVAQSLSSTPSPSHIPRRTATDLVKTTMADPSTSAISSSIGSHLSSSSTYTRSQLVSPVSPPSSTLQQHTTDWTKARTDLLTSAMDSSTSAVSSSGDSYLSTVGTTPSSSLSPPVSPPSSTPLQTAADQAHPTISAASSSSGSYSSTKTTSSSQSLAPSLSPCHIQQRRTDLSTSAIDPSTSAISSSIGSYSSAGTSIAQSSISPSSTQYADPSTSSSASTLSSPQHAPLASPSEATDSVTSMPPTKTTLPRDEVPMSPADATKPEDSEMRKNLVGMISKSQDRRRKTRALPNLQGMPPLKSPTNSLEKSEMLPPAPQSMTPKHSLSPVEGTTLEQSHGVDALKSERSLPLTPVALDRSHMHRGESSLPLNPAGSLTVEATPVNSGWKPGNSLPLSPVEHLQSESPVWKSPDGHLKIEHSLPVGEKAEPDRILKHDSPVIVPPAVKSLQPLAPSSPLIGAAVTVNTSSLAIDEDPKLSGLTSETMIVQLPEDGSSSSDFEARNVMPLELEMESKKDAQPISSDDSVDGSGNSIASDRSLPTELGHVSESVRQANLEEVEATSLPDLDHQYQANQNPGDMLHHLQLSTLRSDKESMQLKLQQAHEKIASLEMENVDLKIKFEKGTVQVKTFEESVEREQKMTAALHQKHAEEVNQVKKEMREQLNVERERLLNQIRELTSIKEHTSAEVIGLKHSLSEAHEFSTSSTSNLERHEANHQVEVENMKIEIQVLQELYDETERSHSNLLQSSKLAEERIDELVSENKMLQQKLENSEDSVMEKGIKLKLQAAEEHISQLQSEKSKAVLAVEQNAADDSIKMQVKHREAMELLQRQLADTKSKLSSQTQRLKMLQDVAQPTTKPENSGRIWPARDQSKTSPAPVSGARYLGDTIAFKNKRNSTVPHHGGSKKHEEDFAASRMRPSSANKGEMAALVSALEKEGHDLVSEETTLHLWKMLEQARRELEKAGSDWEKEKGKLESKLEMANKERSYTEVTAKSTQVVLKQKLESMLQKSHLADEQNVSMRRKQQEVLAENQELKGKLIDLRGKLMDKSVILNNLEADLAGKKRESSFAQKELSIERHQKNVLQSKVTTLEDQVVYQKKEMKDLKGDAKEKLTSAGDHVRQTRHEVANLKAKIGELEGEIALLKQQLSHATEQRETLQSQLDSLTSQLALMETQLHREKAKSIEAQAKLEQLEGETSYRGVELQRELGHCTELQREIATTRKALDIAQGNVSSLETEVITLRAEHMNCHGELSRTTKYATEIETKLQSTTSDLTRFQELAKKLQDTITINQNELETISLSLELERQNNRELQAMVEALNGNAERSGKQLEGMDAQLSSSKKELAEKRLTLQSVQHANHSLKLEAKQKEATCVSLEAELGNSQRNLKAKNVALKETRDVISSLEQDLANAHTEIDNYRIQVEEFQSQLKSNEFENARLIKDREINEIEIQSVMLNVKMTSKQLEEKKTQLQRREEEGNILEQEKMHLASDLSEYKREVHSLASLKNKLENDLDLKASELEIDRSKIAKLQHDVQRKNEALKSFESEVEKLQCGLICEKEQIATLGMEQSTMAEQLQKAREQKRNMEAELERCMEECQANSDHNQMVISQLKGETSHAAEHVETLNNQYTLLEVDYQHSKKMLDSANAQVAKLKALLSKANCNLESANEAKDDLQKNLKIAQQQLDNATTSLSFKITEHEQTSSKLMLCQSQLTDTLQKADKLQEILKAEKLCNLKLQSDFERVGDSLMAVKLDLERAREEDTYEKKKIESLSSEIVLYQTKNQQLARDLNRAQNELIQLKEASEEARTSFGHNITVLRTTFQEEKETWTIENDTLQQEHATAKQQLSTLEKHLNSYECKLQETSSKLKRLEEKCTQQKAELSTKHSIETRCHQLESSQAAAKSEISDLKKRLASQSADVDRLTGELGSVMMECSSLKDKLQYQRETAAASLNRIQKQNQEKCTELHSKIQELNENIKQAHVSLRKAQQEAARVQSEKETLNMCVNEETERNQMLREQLQDKMTGLRLFEEQLSMIQKSDEEGKTRKVQLEQALSEEMLRRHNCEACVQEQKEALESTTYELQECKKYLTKESSTNNSLKQELSQFKSDLSQAKKQLEGLRSLQKNAHQRGEVEMAAMRQKYHGEKKQLKEKLRDLQTELDNTFTQFQNQSDEVCKLASTNKVLMEGHKDAVKKTSHAEQKLQDKKQECNCLRIKLQATEVHVAQLQAETATLEKSQLQVSEYKKKTEARAKKELQKVLAEVTDHMEQQYSAHRYLEKLRTENETIALKDKERTISQLKDDLKVKKQENKQDKLRLEQVKLETSFLKSQQKEQDRSRRRLETRLDQVNDTLSRTLPQPCTNPLHSVILPECSHTSTPAMHRSRTRFTS